MKFLKSFLNLLSTRLVFNGPAVGSDRKFYRMEKTNKSADIYLYDIIGDSWDGTTAKQFATDLKALGAVETLNIFINSPGGSVFDGVAIYNTLIRHRAQKKVMIDGLAGSIASVVAMAGDTIEIAKNGMVMIHNPWAIMMGNAADFRREADVLDQIGATILLTYVDRTNTKEAQIKEWMDAETWLSAEEAVAAGFADSVSERELQVAALTQNADTFKHFKNIPASFKALLEKKPAEVVPVDVPNSNAGQPANETRQAKVDPRLARIDTRVARLLHERAKP
jgi:ATP-dependent Clp protease protease subunit